MIELSLWVTAKFLIKLTKKFGKDWLQKTFKFNSETTDLIYESIEDPTKFGDLLYELQKDRKNSDFINQKLSEIESLPEIKHEPNLLLLGAKVDVYKELLDDIFKIVKIRKHPVVLDGFFNSSEYLSYFEIYFAGDYGVDKKEDHLDLNAFTKITIEKIPDESARKHRLKEQRIKCKDKRANYKYDKLNELSYDISKIYDDFIELSYDSQIVFKKNNNIKHLFHRELEIQNYNGFVAMNTSLQEYISEIVNNLRELRALAR